MKQFELEIGRKLYEGFYHYEGNELMIDSCFRYKETLQQFIEIDSINNKEEFSKVYTALEKDTCDEKMDEAEYNREARYSIAEDKADEKRKL